MPTIASPSPLNPTIRALGAALFRALRRPEPPSPEDRCAERAFLAEMIHRNPDAYVSDLDLIAVEPMFLRHF